MFRKWEANKDNIILQLISNILIGDSIAQCVTRPLSVKLSCRKGSIKAPFGTNISVFTIV